MEPAATPMTPLLRQAQSHPILLALPRRECQTAGIAHHFMILYRLRCSKGHEFESWFKDSKTYERQEKKSLIGCAVCGDSKVARALMAPRLGTKGNKRKSGVPTVEAPAPAPTPAQQQTEQKVAALAKHMPK